MDLKRVKSFLGFTGSASNSQKRVRHHDNSAEDQSERGWVDQRGSAGSHDSGGANAAEPEKSPTEERTVTRQVSRRLAADARDFEENNQTFARELSSGESQTSRHGPASSTPRQVDVRFNNSSAGSFQPPSNGNRARQDLLNDLRRAQREKEQLAKEVSTLKLIAQQEKTQLSAKLRVAETEAAQLRKDLEDCKERIFRLQPQAQMSDAQIGRQYHDLCETIADWVDSDFADFEGYLQTFSWCSFPTEIAEFLSNVAFAEGEWAVMENHPSAELSMTRYIIHAFLHDFVLAAGRRFVGIDETAETLLSSIEDGMRKLVPKRDEEAIGGWKAECYKAMLQNSELCQQRAEYVRRVEEMLVVMFERVLPPAEAQCFNVGKCHEIVQLASRLAVSINSSPSTYRFKYPFVPDEDPETLALFQGEVGIFKMTESDNGHPIRKASVLAVDVDGKIGEKLCVIHPSLIRVGQDGAADLTIEKAAILVMLDHPQSRRGQRRTRHGIRRV